MPQPDVRKSFSRREFLRTTTTTPAFVVAATSLHSLLCADDITAESLPTADQFIAGKDRRLIVHSVTTGEIETPLELLRENVLTPKKLLFVRNNQRLTNSLSLEPANDDPWSIQISGLAEGEKIIPLDDLRKLPQREVEMVLQCSGNGRALFHKAAPTSGVLWRHGAMGNVVFRGVPLAEVLKYCHGTVPKTAKFVAAEGRDTPLEADGADFEHSIPLDDALEKTMLALSLNGEPLPRVHGGPVRLVTPGYYATMNIKWLTALRFEEGESENHHHVRRYRTPRHRLSPGEKFSSTLENSDANWRMKIKSIVTRPLDGEQLAAGPTRIEGVAWNDGVAAIVAVEVSLDGGHTWRQAKLTRPKISYAWHAWSFDAVLSSGPHTVRCRAIDAHGQSQPADGNVAWNPAGYAWNGIDRVNFQVT